MLEQQRTIKKSVSMSGIGLHTGAECTMTFKPAPENYGIRFIRGDLGGNPEIVAIADNVIDVSRGTTLGIGDVKVHTVEHVLAAIAGLQIDNIKIDIDGIEPPVGDGSAMPYVKVLQSAGFETQNSPKDYLIIDKTVMFHDEDKDIDIVALPLDELSANQTAEKVLDLERISMDGSAQDMADRLKLFAHSMLNWIRNGLYLNTT
ncbi:MAG: UDP-3-O-acyl-N-acetylglucosamine deacetylase [Bacteroidetes bacterium]|nr:UDP-3-O-acyl-N-acetylglucosamine deacetylase [Bacteroidota bacterium]